MEKITAVSNHSSFKQFQLFLALELGSTKQGEFKNQSSQEGSFLMYCFYES